MLGWWRGAGCFCACVLTIGGLAACGGSDNTPTAPTATFTAPPTNAPAPTPTATCASTAPPCSCNPPDQCHQAGTCNCDGTCFYLPVPDGTACTNGGTSVWQGIVRTRPWPR